MYKSILCSLAAFLLAISGVARADMASLNARVSSGDWALDYVIQDVCVDGGDNPIAEDPAVCAKHRNVRIGEKVPYLHTDFDTANKNATYQALWSYPVAGTDGTLKIMTVKNMAGSFSSDFKFSFDAHHDGFDLMDTTGAFYSFIRTSDGECFDQLFSSSATERRNGWILFDPAGGGGSSSHTTRVARISSDTSCAKTGQSDGEDVWNPPASVTFEGGKVLKSVVTYHFAGTDLSQENNALERVYFTREYGFTRWEAWMPLSRCLDASFEGSPAAKGHPETCKPDADNYPLRGRCANSNIPPRDNWGNQSWVRVDCRDSSNYVPISTPLIPLDGTMAQANGLVDVDSAAVFGTKALLPPGSYAQSCSACSISGHTLSCTCLNESSIGVASSLDVSGCGSSDIGNRNGSIACAGSSAELPGGSYSESCSHCSLNGNSLSCICLNEKGVGADTSLDLSTCGSSPRAGNANGSLVCGN